MRILSVKLRNYRLHRDLRVEFDQARTVIGGPNETGKSTLVEAVHRALFLPAKGNKSLHRAMESTVHGGAAKVELAFDSDGVTYLLTKNFGTNGNVTLAPSNGLAVTGDAAESLLASVLGVETGIAARATAAQWAHLWVWQGHAANDPSKHATEQQDGLLQRLQKIGGAAVLQSELDTRVANHVAEVADLTYRQDGSPRAGSALERAVTQCARAEEELKSARDRVCMLDQTAVDLERDLRELEAVGVSLAELEKQDEVTAAKARELGEWRLKEAEQSRGLEAVVDKLRASEIANRLIGKTRAERRDLEERLKPQREAISQAELAGRVARDKAETAEAAWRTATEAARAERNRRALAAAYVALFEKSEVHAKLCESEGIAASHRRELSALAQQSAVLPQIDKATLNKVHRFQMECSNASGAVQAMATGLQLIAADKPVKVDGGSLKVGQMQILTEDSEVRIGAGICLLVQPGGGISLAKARQDAAAAQQKLQDLLDGLGLRSADEASEAHYRLNDLASRTKAVEGTLDGMEAESLAEAIQDSQGGVATLQGDVRRLEALASDLTAPSSHAAAIELAKQLEKRLNAAEDLESECRSANDCCVEERETADEELRRLQEEIEQGQHRLRDMEAQLTVLLAQHGDDMARAEALADYQAAKDLAHSRLKATTDAITVLQPELLEDDRVRIERAIKAKHGEQGDLRLQVRVSQAALRSDGSEDPAAKLASATARAHAAGKHRDIVERRAQAIALLSSLFQQEQGKLARQLTQPLADRMSGYLQCIFGAGTEAQVELNSDGFGGLRLARPAAGTAPFAFETLSGGTREQTAAAVRLAMAEVLAADFGGCLPVVFDDAFAYSDPVRVGLVQRMLDLAANRGLQVIVLTCNPADYAALGAKSVALRALSLDEASPEVAASVPAATTPEAGTVDDGDDIVPVDSAVLGVTDDRHGVFLNALDASGGSSGNQALRKRLDWDESTYNAVRNALVQNGEVVKGAGRGGSVSRSKR